MPPTVNATTGGAAVDVNWSAPAGHSAMDVIALCKARARHCIAAQRVGTTASLGTARFSLPSGAGLYQVRYYVRGHACATSASFS